jgi:uncharacterized membrane protein YcgQ (UPF0703/DUF1980 family)
MSKTFRMCTALSTTKKLPTYIIYDMRVLLYIYIYIYYIHTYIYIHIYTLIQNYPQPYTSRALLCVFASGCTRAREIQIER